MRFVTNVTAEKLGSVALRYRRVTVPRQGRVALPRCWWFGASSGRVRRRPRLRYVGGAPSVRGGDPADVPGAAQQPQAGSVCAVVGRDRGPDVGAAAEPHYDETGRAFRVEQIGGGFRLLTRRRFAPWLRRLVHVPPLERLSAPAMETLAVVAYRQPVLRAEIEAIRGVSCGEILRQLMDRDLVRIGGRSDELGRPYLYTTTKRFLQLFGLQSLEELPRAFVLRNDSRSTDQVHGVVTAPVSTDDQQQEQEKSEVSVTLKSHMPVDETFEDSRVHHSRCASGRLRRG